MQLFEHAGRSLVAVYPAKAGNVDDAVRQLRAALKVPEFENEARAEALLARLGG